MTTLGEALGHDYVTVVAIGDSITANTHWTLGALNWVGLLECNLSTAFGNGFTVINSGLSGDDATGGLARIQRDVLRFVPTLTLISFGMNDAGKPDNRSRFRSDMSEMIHRVRDAGSHVLLRTPNPIVSMTDGTEMTEVVTLGQRRTYEVGAYADAIVDLAGREQVWLVDHYTLWKRSMASRFRGEMCMLMGNCIHPNANGHRRFHHEMAPVFGVETTFQHEWQHILERQGDQTG